MAPEAQPRPLTEEEFKTARPMTEEEFKALQPQPSPFESALSKLGYESSSDESGRKRFKKGGFSYAFREEDIPESVKRILGFIEPVAGALSQVDPTVRPVDKALSYAHGLGAGSGANLVLRNTALPLMGETGQAIDQRLQQATQNEPLANMVGGAGGAMVGAPAMIESKIASMAPKMGAIGRGAISGGAYEAVANPDATAGSIAGSAALGGATTGALQGLAKIGKAGADKWSGFLAGDTRLGKYINEVLGPTSSLESLANKNKVLKSSLEPKMQALMEQNADIPINVNEVVDAPTIQALADIKGKVTGQDKKLMGDLGDIWTAVTRKKPITPAQALTLKRSLNSRGWKLSGNPETNEQGKVFRSMASQIDAIMDDTLAQNASKEFQNINKLFSNSINLEGFLEDKFKTTNLDKLRALGEMSAAAGPMAYGRFEPAALIGLERVVSSVPGMTNIGSGANKLNQAMASPLVQRLLGIAGGQSGNLLGGEQ